MAANDSVIRWLLEENQPSVRYLTLTELLDKPPSDPEAEEAAKKITKVGWAREILDKRAPGGYWVGAENLYRPKYLATNWMLLILSDLGLTKDEPAIAKSSRLWMERFSALDGGFDSSLKGNPKYGHLCITGNTARALVKFGYEDHPRVRRAFEWFVKNQAELGGWSCWNYGSRPRGRNLDSWEPMSAFAAYPRQKWTRGMKSAVEKGAEYFLEKELHKQGERYEPWYRFHYPIHYYYDILVGLDFMTALGYGSDRRLGFALSLLKRKSRPDGRWNLDAVNPDPESSQGRWNGEHPNRATTSFALEEAGKPSKVITFTAMRVLKRVDAS
ncbi:MAG: terpene cyclase/mutase family protein [Nitrososphaerota archaeon]|nr:terpene cyclase/mutase family protein [Nitrososphaerota archaeon]MDG7023496.1 terpene cyclase/mutase family protein [Nitrososphaerota archaeon]